MSNDNSYDLLTEITAINNLIMDDESHLNAINERINYNTNRYEEYCVEFEKDFQRYPPHIKLDYGLQNLNRIVSKVYIRENHRLHLRRKKFEDDVCIKIDIALLKNMHDCMLCYDSFNYISDYYKLTECDISVIGTFGAVKVYWNANSNVATMTRQMDDHTIKIIGSFLDIVIYIKDNVGT